MDRCSSPGTFILVFSAWISCCAAFYLPGLAPVSYCEKGKESKTCLVSVVSGSIRSLIISNLRPRGHCKWAKKRTYYLKLLTLPIVAIRILFIANDVIHTYLLILNYYSFKIFPQFWLAKSTCIIHHNQLLMTKFGRILQLMNLWRQKCSFLAG